MSLFLRNALGFISVLAVTRQQQAFDNFIAADRERLHSYADYLSKHEDS